MIVPVALSQLPDTPFLALNNHHHVEVGPALSRQAFAQLVAMAFYAKGYVEPPGFLLVLDQDAAYDNANFRWFKARHARFVYIDRVLIDRRARGMGRARALYQDMFRAATEAGHSVICAEINSDPPNPASDAFHAALGFDVVGTAFLPDRNKTVRYVARQIGGGTGQ